MQRLSISAPYDTMTLGFIEELFKQITALLSECDPTVAGGSGLAIAAVAVWFFVRVVRTVATVLFTLCVVFLVLKIAFQIDLRDYLNFGSSSPAQTAPAQVPAPDDEFRF